MKNTVIKIIIGSLFIGIFNLIFFLSGITLSDANWCTYAFVMASYLCVLSTPLLTKGTGSGVLAGSLWLRATFFFITELITAAVFLLISPGKITWPLIIQASILAIFLFFQLMGVLANDATEASIAHQRNLSFSKQALIEQLQLSLNATEDAQAKQVLNRCIDSLSFCPLDTCPEAFEAELRISEAVNEVCFISEQGGDLNTLRQKAQTLVGAVQNKNLIIKRHRRQ